jgi:hypothetical protein
MKSARRIKNGLMLGSNGEREQDGEGFPDSCRLLSRHSVPSGASEQGSENAATVHREPREHVEDRERDVEDGQIAEDEPDGCEIRRDDEKRQIGEHAQEHADDGSCDGDPELVSPVLGEFGEVRQPAEQPERDRVDLVAVSHRDQRVPELVEQHATEQSEHHRDPDEPGGQATFDGAPVDLRGEYLVEYLGDL